MSPRTVFVRALLPGLLLLTLTGLSARLQATDLFVSPLGSDSSGDGSAANPFRSLTKAMGAAATGDAIHMASGNYDTFAGEGFPIIFKDGVSVRGPALGLGIATVDGRNIFVPLFVVLDNQETTIIQSIQIMGQVNIFEVAGNPLDLRILNCTFIGGARVLNHDVPGGPASVVFQGNTALQMDLEGFRWVASSSPGAPHSLTLLDNRIEGRTDSLDGIFVQASGDLQVILDVRRNRIKKFNDGFSAEIDASTSVTSMTGVVEGNEFSKANRYGVNLVIKASGLGPSTASMDAAFRFNSVTKNDSHGMKVALSAIGSGNRAEFTSPFYGNAIEENDRSGLLLGETAANGGEALTMPDLGGGGLSLGGNTFQRNDGFYSTGFEFDLKVESGDPISATGNWWGTLSPEKIESHVFHAADDPSRGLVDFSGFRGRSLQFTPNPREVSSASRRWILVLAGTGSLFIPRDGERLLQASVGGLDVRQIQVAQDGKSLMLRLPNLGRDLNGILPLLITNPGQQQGKAKLAVTGDSQGGGFCFLATAAYDDPGSPELKVLRRWRDEHLAKTRLGRLMIRTYYELSPPLADAIAGHAWARSLTRALLAPVVWALSLWME
ncbi:MAG: CFI-box-CTERM domain-containing protein [Planctomycetota bacterium]